MDKLNRRNVTVVYVTHHVEEIVPLFTHVALIRAGKLAGAGPKREVLNSELMLAAYELPVDIEWEDERPWIKIKRRGLSI
ncbi:putative ABC transporter ATP-binding protein YlmA [compost metagenome]